MWIISQLKKREVRGWDWGEGYMILHTMLYHSLFSHSPVNGHWVFLSLLFFFSFILKNDAMYIIEYAKKKKIPFQVGLGPSHAVPCLGMSQYGTDLESVSSPDTKRWCREEAFALLSKHFLRGQQTTMHVLFWFQLRMILQMNIWNQFNGRTPTN